jgi:hypothetical protein
VRLTILLAAATLCHGEISCPASIRVSDKVEAAFLRVSVLNQNPGGPEYDLAPSSTDKAKNGDLTQVWKLADYRDMNIVLRCRYRGTESVRNIALPVSVQACTFKFRLDAKGNFLGTSQVTCK